jgi:hypothetical protein
MTAFNCDAHSVRTVRNFETDESAIRKLSKVPGTSCHRVLSTLFDRSGMSDSEFRRILDHAYEACRRNGDKPWVLEPYDDIPGVFKGILFGTSSSHPGPIAGGHTAAQLVTPTLGCVFSFDLQIDEAALSNPPHVTFSRDIQHPLIDPATGAFCFPAGPDTAVSCRTDSFEVIMETLTNLFFLTRRGPSRGSRTIRDPTAGNCVNPAARALKMTKEAEFWTNIQANGFFGGPPAPDA